MIVDHFETQYSRSLSGRFVIPLPRRVNASTIGESRSQAIRRFVYLKRLLSSKGLSGQFNDVIHEYFDMGHAEPVPESDLPPNPDCTKGFKYNHQDQSGV